MLRIMNISKRYKKKKALRHVSLDLDTGIIGLVGPNGSGKTTFLRILSGLKKANTGYIFYQDEPLSRNLISLNLDIYEVYNYRVNKLGILFNKFYKDFRIDIYNQILKENKINESDDFDALSKGQKTLVTIALTLARDVPIYLLDEPFSGLDIMVRKKIIDGMIKYLDLQNKIVIISSHDFGHLERLITSVIVLKEGKIVGQKESYDIDSLKKWYKELMGGIHEEF